MNKPTISIGMPVYNGTHFIRDALDSLLAQTFADFDLTISDNASTDDTEDICLWYASRDKRIKYVRQPVNLGAAANFDYVLGEATGDYFMWAAADDTWGRSFLEVCKATLEKSPRAVGAISNAVFGEVEGLASGIGPLDAKMLPKRRVMFLMRPGPNARFYSLYRSDIVKKLGYNKYDFFAGDWAFIFDLLEHGSLITDMSYLGFFKRSFGAGSDTDCLKLSLQDQGLPLSMPMLSLLRHIYRRSILDAILYLPYVALLNYKTVRWLNSK